MQAAMEGSVCDMLEEVFRETTGGLETVLVLRIKMAGRF